MNKEEIAELTLDSDYSGFTYDELDDIHMSLKSGDVTLDDPELRKKVLMKVRRLKREFNEGGNTPLKEPTPKKKKPKIVIEEPDEIEVDSDDNDDDDDDDDPPKKKRKPSGPGAQKPRTQHRRKRQLRKNETTHLHPLIEEIPEWVFDDLSLKHGLKDKYVRGQISQPILHVQQAWSSNLNMIVNDGVPVKALIDKFVERFGWQPEWFTAYRQGQRHYIALGPIEMQYRKS